MKKILLFVLLCLFCIQSSQVNAFLFWLKSSDNTVEDIINLEKSYNLYLPLIWFIYDPWEQQDVIWNLKDMAQLLWNQRIYHITISPDSYSAADVANWKFDEQYSAFFKTIKELNLKVIFRTMHEVNWGWYPWSWNPDEFKKAWNHVWNLSRSLWLTNHDILFDFSVNHRDPLEHEKKRIFLIIQKTVIALRIIILEINMLILSVLLFIIDEKQLVIDYGKPQVKFLVTKIGILF